MKYVHTNLTVLLALLAMIWANSNVTDTPLETSSLAVPIKEDLEFYVKSLRKVVAYFEKTETKEKGDVNVGLGLFFISVNLKTVLRYEHNPLPKSLQHQLQDLIERAQLELAYIIDTYQQIDKNKDRVPYQFDMFLMNSNDSAWADHIAQLDVNPPPPLNSTHQIITLEYEAKDLKNGTWVLGMACMSSLVQNVVRVMDQSFCAPKQECYKFLKDGVNHGYALTHRILMLLFARFERECVMFSITEDKQLTTRLCSSAYAEAKYIATHQLTNVFIDLFSEQVALCLLAGHSEFYRRSWLTNLLEYQRDCGCFGFTKLRHKNSQRNPSLRRKWILTLDFDMHKCIDHPSAVAAAALAAGVRFTALRSVKNIMYFSK